MNRFIGLTAIATLAVGVAGCSSKDDVATLADLPHVHNVAISGDTVYVGSHEGLYAFVDDDRFVRVSPDFDVMGLAVTDEQFFASGHPGPGFGFPDPVGLLTSIDGGETWTSVSLTGDVDFHRLDVSGDTILGAAANYQMVVVSTDGGLTWGSMETPDVYDFSLNPTDPSSVVMASSDGLLLSTDSGASYRLVEGPAGVVAVDWSPGGLVVATPTTVYVADSIEGPFQVLRLEFDAIIDLTRQGDTIAVIDGHTLSVSRDGGKTFTSK